MLSLEDVLAIAAGPCSEPPLLENFMCILQKCQNEKKLAYAKSVYTSICDNGLEAHTAIGNCLVSIFAGCGSLTTSHQIFNRLVYQDDISWNSLVQGYIKLGKWQQALKLVQEMDKFGIRFSRCTFLAVLSVCTTLKCMETGREIHALIAKEGYAKDLFVGSALVDIYAKFGLLVEAREMCDELPARNVVSWNALITGLAEHGLCEEVLDCLEQMQTEGVFPDVITYICSLRAVSSIGDREMGRTLHTDVVMEGFEGDPVVGNTLVSLYAKCGSFIEAQDVFDELQLPDVVSWTALIAGYAECGMGEEALKYYERMQLDGVSPDAITLLCSLKACGTIGAIDKGLHLHTEIAKEGFEMGLFTGNALVDMYAKCGWLVEAQEVFDELPVRDVVSWNALMAGYAEYGFSGEVLSCLEQMQVIGIVSPNSGTFACSLKACVRGGAAIIRGLELHNRIAEEGYEVDTFVSNALVDMYANYGLLEEACHVFNNMSARDVVSWNALITGYAKCGLYEEALNCLGEMKLEGKTLDAVTCVGTLKIFSSKGAVKGGLEMHAEIVKVGIEGDPFVGNTLVDMYAMCGAFAEAQEVLNKLQVQDAISWNALLSGYAKHGLVGEVLNCLVCMQLEGISSDAVTFVCGLTACGSVGAISRGREIHMEIAKRGVERDCFVGNSLVDMYGKCGSMADAQEVFNEMPSKDIVTWNALITGYAGEGESELAFDLFERMKKEGIQPDGVTLLGVLTVCSHVGLLNKCQQYFAAMGKEYGVSATIKHLNCMLDLLGRTGQLDEAVTTLEILPFQPDVVTWNTLLGASQKWSNLEFGRHAFDHVVRSDEKHAAAFIMMSNICMDDYVLETKEIEANACTEGAMQEVGQD